MEAIGEFFKVAIAQVGHAVSDVSGILIFVLIVGLVARFAAVRHFTKEEN
jgi:hypothetical protein